MTKSFSVRRTADFDAWMSSLKDVKGRAQIILRVNRIRVHGHFGDCESVGAGVSELRIHVGPGYRVYFTRKGGDVDLLLCGGDKSSQARDIARAKDLAGEE